MELENQTIKNPWGITYISSELETKKVINNNTISERERINNRNINLLIDNYYRNDSLYRTMNSFNFDPLKQLDSIKSLSTNSVSKNLTNEVLEVFEILSSICINSVIINNNEIYNLNYTSALVQNIINIIFGEIEKATTYYLEF